MEPARRKPLRIKVEITPHVVGEPYRIGLVIDRERRAIPEQGRLASEDPRARRVERRDPHLAGDRADERGNPLLHLTCGLVREGDREDLERRDVPFGDEIRHPMCEESGFPRARAGDDEHRPVGRGHGIALHRIQTIEELRHAHGEQRTGVRVRTLRPTVGRAAALALRRRQRVCERLAGVGFRPRST